MNESKYFKITLCISIILLALSIITLNRIIGFLFLISVLILIILGIIFFIKEREMILQKLKQESLLWRISLLIFIILAIINIAFYLPDILLINSGIMLLLVVRFYEWLKKEEEQLKVKIINYFNLFYFFKVEQLPELLPHYLYHHIRYERSLVIYPDP